MRRTAGDEKLTSDSGDLVNIHHSESQQSEDNEHVSHCRNAIVIPIVPMSDIATPMENRLHGPLCVPRMNRL
jgi:hypothetical protein